MCVEGIVGGRMTDSEGDLCPQEGVGSQGVTSAHKRYVSQTWGAKARASRRLESESSEFRKWADGFGPMRTCRESGISAVAVNQDDSI